MESLRTKFYETLTTIQTNVVRDFILKEIGIIALSA